MKYTDKVQKYKISEENVCSLKKSFYICILKADNKGLSWLRALPDYPFII